MFLFEGVLWSSERTCVPCVLQFSLVVQIFCTTSNWSTVKWNCLLGEMKLPSGWIKLPSGLIKLPSGWNYPGPSQGFGPGLIGPSVQQYFEVVNILWWNPLWRAWPPSWLALNTLHGSLSADVRANSSRHLGICRVQRVMEGVMPHKKTYRYGTVSCLGTDISGASCRKLVVWRTLIQVVNMHCISGRTPTPLHLSRINLQSPRTNIDQWWYCFYRLHHWLF